MLKDITIVIKSFLRKKSVDVLIKSIRQFYPTISIIVIDDSDPPLIFDYDDNIKTYNLDFDSGLSAGRNYGVSKVTTKYFLLLDDDFIFTELTNLELLLNLLQEYKLDILGGQILTNGKKPNKFFGTMHLDTLTNILVCEKKYKDLGEVKICNIIPNFFLANTDAIIKHPWNEKLKMGEHAAFFFNIVDKLTVGITDTVKINHNKSIDNSQYKKYRKRSVSYHKQWMLENNINAIKTFEGKTIFAKE